MRLASVAQLARAGLLQAGETCPRALAASSVVVSSDAAQQVRTFGHAAPAIPSGPKTPLQTIMPLLLGIVPAAVKLTSSVATGTLSALASNDTTKKLVTDAANKALISEALLNLKDLDLPKWVSWLSAAGYTDKAGYAKLAAAIKDSAAGLSPAETAQVIGAFGAVGYYDKALFSALADNMKAAFTELETDALLSVASVYNKAGHVDIDLLDDVADGIAYCNHYLAPVYSPLSSIAAGFEAYAAAGHDRTDLFVGLARAVNEDKLMKLPGGERKEVVLSLLRSFDALGFWPDATEGLFAVADATEELAEDERREVAVLLAKVTTKAGGELKYYNEGVKDPEHYHGPSFGEYNLYAFRDSLLPKYYSPSSLKA